MKLEGINSIEEAERFRGGEILIQRDAVTREEEEYFWYELIGLKVFLDTGEHIGVISRIIPTGSNEIYVVENEKREVFVPATYEIVKEIDLETGRMTI